MILVEERDTFSAEGQFEAEALLQYRRTVAEIYARVRNDRIPVHDRWQRFVQDRDLLFATHTQSALTETQKMNFKGLDYFPYDPSLRYLLNLDRDVKPRVFELQLRDDGLVKMRRIGKIHLELAGKEVSLFLYWMMGYAGGLFLPFRDATNRLDTYGGGRYLLDTIKDADLGNVGGKLVIDFNFAYNPSCAYNSQWDCPLPPSENWLDVPIRAGEKAYLD